MGVFLEEYFFILLRSVLTLMYNAYNGVTANNVFTKLYCELDPDLFFLNSNEKHYCVQVGQQIILHWPKELLPKSKNKNVCKSFLLT